MESGKTALGILAGIGAGVILGVLFAPDKGSNTRKKIMDRGQGLADDLKAKYEGLYEEISDKFDNFVEQTKSTINPK